MSEYRLIGKIVGVFGIKGELKVKNYTDFIELRYDKDSYIYVGKDKIPYQVYNYRLHNDKLLISLKDHLDINLVEHLINLDIYKNIEDIKPLNDGEYYFSDLVGLNIIVNKEIVGKVIKMEEGVTCNYLIVETKNGNSYVPYMKQYVLDVNIEEKYIEIIDLKGLL